MTASDRRTPEQIRGEIAAERAELDAKLTALGADAKRTGRVAGRVIAAAGGALLLVRLAARRRGR